MDRERWIKAGRDIGDLLKDIRAIIRQNGIDHLSISLYSDSSSTGTYIDDEEKEWDVTVYPDGTIGLEEDGFQFYIKM